MKAAEELTAILQVTHQLDVAILQQVRVCLVAHSREAARTDGPHGEGSDAVGAAYIEHLAIGQPVAIAVGIDDAGIDVRHEF